jgi:hypothetical protein
MTLRISAVALGAALAAGSPALAQQADIYVPRNIQQAYDNGTRSLDGAPGLSYWQNGADYVIRVDFDPHSGLLRGSETITYRNNSPDTLRALVLDLHANYYRVGTARDWPHAAQDLGEGVTIDALAMDGVSIDVSGAGPEFHYMHNGMFSVIRAALAPGAAAELEVSWHYVVNPGSHMRTGRVDSTTYFVAYFFPRLAVYDDVDGWDTMPYSGNLEFYNDFGDFDLTVTVPQGTVVWATGLLQNADEVLAEPFAGRYRSAATTDTIVHVVTAADVAGGGITAAADANPWRFTAEYVSDVAFAVSDHYLWDAASLVVDSSTGRRVLVEAAFADSSADFHEVAAIARAAIEMMSFEIPAVPFPFPNMTVFNGLGEMEYPMMVNDHSFRDNRHETVWLTSHEVFHSYFPFYMGINETKYAWMDEGWAVFGDFNITNRLHTDDPTNIFGMDMYQEVVGDEVDIPMFAASFYSKRPAYFYASYPKPAFFYLMLRDLLGTDLFMEALHEYMRRWNGRHPTPYDFFLTFNHVTGQDLSWLYRPWFFEFGYADVAIRDVSRDGAGYEITVERVGANPVPVHLQVTYEDGTVQRVHETAAVWQDGRREHVVTVGTERIVSSIALGAPHIPDADKSDNIWSAP